jgi:PAS domain S-box-containing protein
LRSFRTARIVKRVYSRFVLWMRSSDDQFKRFLLWLGLVGAVLGTLGLLDSALDLAELTRVLRGTSAAHGPSLTSVSLTAALALLALTFAVLLGRSESRLLERLHRSSETARAQLQALFEQASDGIFVADLHGRYTDVNHCGAKLLGYEREELIGKAIADLIPADQVARLDDDKDRLLAGETVINDWTLRHKDGHWVPVEVSAKILPDGRWQGFVRDITKRKEMEAANARLFEAAKKALRSRDEVLAIVAHDLRNPLNVIKLATGSLARAIPEDARATTERPLRSIGRAADRAARLIQDLLDIQKIESGLLTVRSERLPVSRIIDECVETQGPIISAGELEFRLDVEPDLPDVRADRSRVLQVLENLISNALKFSHSGGRIVLSAHRLESEVVMGVEDTGVGIREDQLPHLFNRFWQGEAGDQRGSGLGLTIARGIISAHGGRMWIESKVGEGTKVQFTLPLAPPMPRLVESATI